MKKLFIIILFLNSCETEIQDFDTLTDQNNSANQSQIDVDGDGILNDFDLDNTTRQGAEVDANGVMINPIYLDDNKITIKAKEWSISGDIGLINEIEYEVISEDELRKRILNNEDITRVCTSKITLMTQLFDNNKTFNQDISTWDTSNVNGMNFMFNLAEAFNQNISSWNTTNVQDMNYMFRNASSFNQNIRFWDTSNVSIMKDMFSGAVSFNQDLSSWNVLKVYDCQSIFFNTPSWTLQKPNFTFCSP